MASSMLAGERRWVSARRGGMTVLGKVPVPKPLNLPSQRLENHGLDPNVEIVPRGTLSWGNRSSSSASNAWNSSVSSPTGDGGTNSPSHLSARPSSSGSCTRPSTAGSDRTHEPTANAWSSKSRPSSASGTLTSNQSSTSLRPRSAEARPNSSHLSRFAEPVSESSVAWGPSSAAERLGLKSSKDDGFFLSSGDFPTLGSDRDNSVKNTELQDHGSHDQRSASSGMVSQTEGKTATSQDVVKSNTWKRDGTRTMEDVIHPSMEKFHGVPHQHHHTNIPPRHFDSWRGPPINAPPGVWYRGPPPGGPPFGAPVAPGGFHMEPFSYHRPQVLSVPFAGLQPVPAPGVGPRGPHPKNGDFYRTQMPDSYARPAMPFRPGFYPGPMTFDTYYGQPMGYCNANERENPYKGMPAGPPVFNRHLAQTAPDPSNSHGIVDGRGSTAKTLLEQVEADNLEDSQGAHGIPLKNHNGWHCKDVRENREHNLPSNISPPGKDGQPVISSRKMEWGADDDVEEDIFSERTIVHENSSFSVEGHSSDIVKLNEGMGNAKAVNDTWKKKSESVLCFAPEIPQQTSSSGRNSSLLATAKDSALMHKIEGLNAKVRSSDGRDISYAHNREEQSSRSQVEAKNINTTVEASNAAGSFKRIPASGDFVPDTHEPIAPAGNKIFQSTTSVSRTYHGVQGRVDHGGKGKFNSRDGDGWKKPVTAKSSIVIATSNAEYSSVMHAYGTNFISESVENSVIYHGVKDEGESSAESYDSTYIQAQRVTMRETAKQHALQLQKEEEERTREQKAKAFAKLEELNRRTRAGEAGTRKAERTQAIGVVQGEQEESHVLADPVSVDFKFQDPSPTLVSESGVVSQDRDSSASHPRESANVPRDLPLEAPQTAHLQHVPYDEPLPLKQDSYNASAKHAFQADDGSASRPKRTVHKQKQNDTPQKNLNGKSAFNVTGKAQKDLPDVAVNDVTVKEVNSSAARPSDEPNASNTSSIMAEPSTQHIRKSNSSKNKLKQNEAAVNPVLPTATPKESNPAKGSIENVKSKAYLTDLDSSVSAMIEPDGLVQSSEVQDSLHDEETHSKVGKQWKPQSHRNPRSLQANRIVDKFHTSDTVMWAPVGSQNKAEGGVEAGQNSSPESAASAKIDNLAQNGSKSKRAEMERYVPKPVAKELAQQGNIQPVSSSNSPTLEDVAAKAQPGSAGSASQLPVSSAIGIVGTSVDFNEGDGRHNKLGKAHGNWQQRNSPESSYAKSVHHGQSTTSSTNRDSKRSTENHFVNLEINASKSEPNTYREIGTLGNHNIPNDTEIAAAGKSSAVKDQVVTVGKRYLSKGHKNLGSNHDPEHKNIVSDESASPNVNQTDGAISLKGHSFGERASSHWQPKPHTNSANNQHRGRAARSETVNREIDRVSKRDHPPQRKVHAPPQDVKKSYEANRPHPDEFTPESNTADEPSIGLQESNRERKANPMKGRPYSPSEVPVGAGESDPFANTACEHESSFSSGFRRKQNQNNRSGRGRESHGDWSSGRDSRQHNVPAFRERQRQNVHYEYQPVGQYKNSKTDKLVGPGDGSNDVGPRYRERMQSHSKHGGGNFHRQASAPARVDPGYD